MLQLRLIIRGKVQKVGFRYSVLQYVGQLPQRVTGQVANLPDGSVELIAQGPIEALKSIHRFATKGPERAEVREVWEEIIEIDEATFQDFSLAR